MSALGGESYTLEDRAMIVTGASSGIGRAIAESAAEEGARVALAARRVEKLEEVAESCREKALGPDAEPRGEAPEKDDIDAMSLEECTTRIMEAIHGREREVVMTLKGKLGQWAKLIAPELLDKVAADAVQYDTED